MSFSLNIIKMERGNYKLYILDAVLVHLCFAMYRFT